MDLDFKQYPAEWFVGILCTITLLMLLHRAFIWQPTYVPLAPPVACKGQPIVVPYSYRGSDLSPHACAVQCEDQIQRYVLYTDGFATQCEPVPGCFDEGEDEGVVCTIPQ